MIYKSENCEYNFITMDLIVTLDASDLFLLKIWIAGNPTPLTYDDTWTLCFLQEGIRAELDNVIQYVFYDNIDTIEVIK